MAKLNDFSGCLISNYHVVKDAAKVRLLTGAGLIDAKVVQVDAANDLALLKANEEGRMQNAETGQPQTSSNRDFIIHPSAFNLSFKPLPIAASRTVNLGGTVATVGFPDIGLQGFVPKQAKGEIAALAASPETSGENVNYAVKSPDVPGLSLLESVPAVSAKLKAPITADRKFEDVVKSAQDAAVRVLVY